MDRTDYLAQVASDSAAVLDAARLGLGPSVDHCPGWTVRSVVEHLGSVHRWVEQMVRTRATERLRRSEMTPPPEGEAELIEWFEAGAAQLVQTLETTPADEPAWNWSIRPHVAGFWPRRMAHETAVHRWDAQRGHGVVTSIDAALAVDAVDEVFDTIVPTMLADGLQVSLGGTLHLHCTDVDGEWLVHLDSATFHVRREHAKGDCAVRGAASDIELLLQNRPVRDRVEVLGDGAVLDAWSAVTF